MKPLLTSLACALAFALPGAAAAKTLKVAVAAEPYPPMYYPSPSGQWQGFEVDLAQAVCKAAKLDCEVTAVAWDGLIPSLNGGHIDMVMASMSITEERRKQIDFSNKYYDVPPLIVSAKEAPVDKSPASFKGKTIGVQVATIHAAYAQKHFAPAGATVKVYQNQDEANSDLVSGRVDATMADTDAMQTFLKSDGGKACCETRGNPEPDPGVLGQGVGIGLRKGQDALREQLNAAIQSLRDSGEYQRIAQKYFSYDVYGQ
ncbi:transporter substrate-binding domain-containing protein [Vandammella animalimorsus]|uniref:transporter substrate-binding domain-containing protein n=1 Tax=Vandammella animalimorsus TaxID=2029117 RepID=UPI00325B1559